MCEALTDRFRSPSPASSAERLYIDRGTPGRRNLVNEGEVRALLEAKGFSVINPGNLSIRDQADLFGNAREVVAVHGAALTNLAFCKPGTKVVELLPRNYALWHFASLAEVRNLDYRVVVGCEFTLRSVSAVGVPPADLRVRLRDLEAALRD